MDAKTLEALNASIEKWEKNAVAEKSEEYLVGSPDCPLCVLFHSAVNSKVDFYNCCCGCPVFQKTGLIGCGGTPYMSAVISLRGWEMGSGSKKDAHKAARLESAFLKSLLPTGEA